MKILVLGGGVIGVSAAYILGERGHEVEVIDRCAEVGSETSFANGGQLSFSHAEPWANPLVIGKVFSWMLKKDSPIVLRPSLDPHMLSWTLSFLLNCQKSRCDRNSINLLRLGLYSKQVTEKIRVMSGVQFDSLRQGILHIFSNPKDFDHAVHQAEFQNKFSGSSSAMEIMTSAECLQKEPTLARSERKLVGGVFSHIDESGDACKFTRNLAEICTNEFNTQFRTSTVIQKIETHGDEITGVVTDKGFLTADAYVMAMGSYSYLSLKQIGINVPIYPMKGYSVSIPCGDYPPTLSITDYENKVVISRLGGRLRGAGTAEFAGYNTAVREARITPIVKAMQGLFPSAIYGNESMTKWACLRPSTPDGLPIIGRSKYKNLFLNTGHGTLGWTQAGGSANLLADVIENRQTEISLTGMDIERF